jgi:hypothetical protein
MILRQHVYGILLVTLNSHKALLVALVLFAFVGQTVTPAFLHCQTSKKSQQSSMKMVSMTHAAHMSHAKATNTSTSGNPLADCCNQLNTCDMGNCVAAVLLPESSDLSPVFFSQNIDETTFTAINRPPTSLYRPPILA